MKFILLVMIFIRSRNFNCFTSKRIHNSISCIAMSIHSDPKNYSNICNKIAVGQLCSSSSKISNLLNVAKCAGWAKRDGCNFLFLPECFGYMGESAAQTLQSAEPDVLYESIPENDFSIKEALKMMVDNSFASESNSIDLPTLDVSNDNVSLLKGLKTIAKESNLWISGGGMHVSGAPPSPDDAQNSRVYNTHVIIDNFGELQCFYRKIHLFDVSIPGKVSLRESATTAPGTELKICDSPIGKFIR